MPPVRHARRRVARCGPVRHTVSVAVAVAAAGMLLPGLAAGVVHAGPGPHETASRRPAQHGPTPARAAGCRDAAPTTATGYQRLFDRTTTPGWAAGDGAFSTALPDGRVVWLFGDTVQARPAGTDGRPGGWRMVHNSMLLQDRGCLTPVSGAGRGPVIPGRGRAWYWPTAAMLDGGRLAVFASRVTATPGAAPLGFASTGVDLALFDLRGSGPRLVRVAATPASGSSETGVQWGAGVLARPGWTYVYGTRLVSAPHTYGRELYVARVPSGALGDPRRWIFYDGARWAPTAARLAPLVAAAGGPSAAVSVVGTGDGGVTVVSKKDDFLGRDVVAWTAPTPWGPFTERPPVLTAPSFTRPGAVTYLAVAHPGLTLAGGRTLVTVSRNNLDPRRALADVGRLKPQFAAVELPG